MLCPRTLLHVKKRYGDSCHASWMEFNLRSWLFCTFKPLIPQADWRLTSTLQYHPWITREGHKITRNDHHLKKLLIVKQILLVNTIGNIYETLCGICILMLRWKRLTKIKIAMWSTELRFEKLCAGGRWVFSLLRSQVNDTFLSDYSTLTPINCFDPSLIVPSRVF